LKQNGNIDGLTLQKNYNNEIYFG